MAKYRAKTEPVEAEQWRPGIDIPGVVRHAKTLQWGIERPAGWISLKRGDWVVKRPGNVSLIVWPAKDFDRWFEKVIE